MSDLSQPAVYGLLQKRLGSADPTNNPRGTVIDIATTQRVHQKYKRPASAPPRALPPGVELRHRAWAPPPTNVEMRQAVDQALAWVRGV